MPGKSRKSKSNRTRDWRSECPLNIALEIFGDRWSLLVVRDLMFMNRPSFKELLDGGEKIATNILADRLRKLEAEGIVSKWQNPADSRKIVYRLTEKGIDLAPVLIEMIVWSARYEKTAAPAKTVREMRENRERFIAEVRNHWAKTDPLPDSPMQGTDR